MKKPEPYTIAEAKEIFIRHLVNMPADNVKSYFETPYLKFRPEGERQDFLLNKTVCNLIDAIIGHLLNAFDGLTSSLPAYTLKEIHGNDLAGFLRKSFLRKENFGCNEAESFLSSVHELCINQKNKFSDRIGLHPEEAVKILTDTVYDTLLLIDGKSSGKPQYCLLPRQSAKDRKDCIKHNERYYTNNTNIAGNLAEMFSSLAYPVKTLIIVSSAQLALEKEAEKHKAYLN